MGIGNRSKKTLAWMSAKRSLPLMGIGNWGWPGARRAPAAVSLPLMGIGNPAADAGGPGALDDLITPHGDRKLLFAAGGAAVIGPSLPLMGIGNAGAGEYGGSGGRAHYPSWGSETYTRLNPLL